MPKGYGEGWRRMKQAAYINFFMIDSLSFEQKK